MFKLADEAQMGGLNSLMAAVETVSGKSNHVNNEIHQNKNLNGKQYNIIN